MNLLMPSLLLITAFLAVYAQAAFDLFRHLFGVQVDLLPPLVVYMALTHGVGWTAALAVVGGLFFDSLSFNPLGTSILPLFVVGVVVYRFRELLLRDLFYAQFILGLMASALTPLLGLALLLSLDVHPLVGWASLWQWVVITLLGGVLTPALFSFFDRLERALVYQRVPDSTSFRPDFNTKRGRH